jgi:AraC-like DNA-binding protein
MNVYLDLLGCFYLFCIMQGFTTAALLFWRREAPANRWLAWLMLGLTLQVTDYFLSRSGVYFRHQWLYFMPLFFSWSFGPLLYGYVRARVGQPVQLPRWYFVPVLVQALFYAFLTVQSLETKSGFWQVVHKPYTRYAEHYVACGMVLYAIYRTRPIATDRWLRYLLAGLGTFYIIAAIDPLLNHLYTPPRWPKFYLTALALPLFVYVLALIGLLYDRLQKPRQAANLPAITPQQRERVLAAIQQNELYKDPDLTLSVLAQHLGETPNAVSRIINAGFNQSFNDFINAYRIDDVKRRMAAGDTAQFTILALALDAGFASKTTFNRVFKEQTGQTPQQYLKEQ